ncbi:glycosyltransferase family 29 protein [Streptomyces sp. ST2-7A]|uniref:glycosyltransferase family 29 protein n=1 Tax=Streptomyces sp. ST2-7A TaxID=2907214 RepID=UPI001F2992A2|nr:glycosyltransferase family 29 protein [Streptomyces sp. ST2-7A]MCE7082706.1 glycosyltransferase family 29 protein [Streptomyces sp. ST2-7A]
MQFTIGRSTRRKSASAGEGRAEASALAERMADCAVVGGQLVGNADPARAGLGEAVRALLAAYAEALTDPTRSGVLLADDNRWPKEHPAVFEGLLRVGQAAVDTGVPEALELARRVTDTVLGAREGSRAGWRLRARVLEALGDDRGAVEAHGRYLALCTIDDVGTGARITALRESREQLEKCVAELLRACPGAARHTAAPPTESRAAAGRARDAGDLAGAAEHLIAASAAMLAADRPLGELSEALTAVFDHRPPAGSEGFDPLADPRLVEMYSTHRRLLARESTPDPLLGDTSVIGLSDFRNLITGRSVCLVANSQRVATSGMGKEIDDYDLVVRFNSFRVDAPNTGRRTDIHATIHKHNFNWDVPVDTRLVFGGKQGAWLQSVRRRLVPGAQRHVNDRSLRWPVREIGRVTEEEWPSIPTSGFNMLWLLDFLDVNPRLDLIGFDFYASGAYRLQGAMKLPITSVHEYRREREWIMERARHADEMRIALR